MAALVYVAFGGGIEVQVGAVFRTAFAGEDEPSAWAQSAPGGWDGFAQVADVQADLQRGDDIVGRCRGFAQGIVQVSDRQAVVQVAAPRLFEHVG